MDRDFKAEIIALLNAHQIMTIATLRRDGWPQATVVSYANEGLVLYTIIGRNTQKYLNIVRDPRVSVAISSDWRNRCNTKVSRSAATRPSWRIAARSSGFVRSC